VQLVHVGREAGEERVELLGESARVGLSLAVVSFQWLIWEVSGSYPSNSDNHSCTQFESLLKDLSAPPNKQPNICCP
jgi:hypothetical protein